MKSKRRQLTYGPLGMNKEKHLYVFLRRVNTAIERRFQLAPSMEYTTNDLFLLIQKNLTHKKNARKKKSALFSTLSSNLLNAWKSLKIEQIQYHVRLRKVGGEWMQHRTLKHTSITSTVIDPNTELLDDFLIFVILNFPLTSKILINKTNR